MKKEIPSWAVISAIAVAAIIGVFFVVRAASGPPELPAPKIKVKQEIPEHLKGHMTPEMEKEIREQTQKYGEIDPNAPANSGPPAGPPTGTPSRGMGRRRSVARAPRGHQGLRTGQPRCEGQA